MREYKFRSWHKTSRTMEVDIYPGESFRWLKEGQPIEIMQFTGLRDKNGREIYEGDIVSWGGSMYGFGQVVYEEYSFVVKYKLGKVLDTMYFNHPDAYTVIGNIHENPDLVTTLYKGEVRE